MVTIADRLQADRDIGAYWERQFCQMAADHGYLLTPLQIGRKESARAYYREHDKRQRVWQWLTLPDITLWTHPGQHHEIKHKEPTKYGSIGLEKYRLMALVQFADETRQAVYYTIHRHDLAGGKEVKENRIEHWITQEIHQLEWLYVTQQAIETKGQSYVNGKIEQNVTIIYWQTKHFMPLESLWMERSKPNHSRGIHAG